MAVRSKFIFLYVILIKLIVSQKVPPFGGHYVDYIVYLHLESSFGPLLCVPIGTTNMLTACRPQTSP